MTGSFWGALAWLLFILACVGAAGVLAGFLLHWTLEYRDARRSERGTLPR